MNSSFLWRETRGKVQYIEVQGRECAVNKCLISLWASRAHRIIVCEKKLEDGLQVGVPGMRLLKEFRPEMVRARASAVVA